MVLHLRRMPGGHQPQKFRLLFQRDPSVHGLEHYIVGTMTDLQAFLVAKLNMPANTASQLAIEAESTGSSYTELRTFDESEVKVLLRGLEAEARTAEQSRGKTVPVTP
jgi:hypothetical protein